MAARLTRILVFAREPIAGRAKTRLIPALGEEGAARLARIMLGHALIEAAAANLGPVELVGDPHPDEWEAAVTGVATSAQVGAGLGERMGNAVERALIHDERVIVTGTDCPGLDATRIAEAAGALGSHDVAIIPATDGGYVLIGFARFDPAIFAGVEWGGDGVLAATLANIQALGWTVWQGEPLADIDEPEDLKHAPATWLVDAGR
ncbi:MAG TPA: TIGR04282 family arsenosugar biosynthesis glycosyltransferase [Sphingomicrobium sp.]|nr:TIGR04282 family arsenosugar biosynthesis glycosyltransferase [Sphingomicrobium sp.]